MTNPQLGRVTWQLYDGGFRPHQVKELVGSWILPTMVFCFPDCCVEAPSARVGSFCFNAIYLWMQRQIHGPVRFHIWASGQDAIQ